ncbi:hypothetical protein NMY22_g19055 [Coprinellus aureogranulatus]|nr:hypothetical protein NMY22_g19055 [Coprinellus aureogranulatus]
MLFTQLLTFAGFLVSAAVAAPLPRGSATTYDISTRTFDVDTRAWYDEDVMTARSSVDDLVEAFEREEDDELVTRALTTTSPEFLALKAKIEAGLKTAPNTAVFWSGTTDGKSVMHDAEAYAQGKNKVTLEMVLRKEGIEDQMPKWPWNPADNEASSELWRLASLRYAQQASGEVDVILGKEVRAASVYLQTEQPFLLNSKAVTKVTEYQTGKPAKVIKG